MQQALKATVLRKQNSAELHTERRGKIIRDTLPSLLAMANGDISVARAQHYEQGCCHGPDRSWPLHVKMRESTELLITNTAGYLLAITVVLQWSA